MIHAATMILVIWDEGKRGENPPYAKVDKWTNDHLTIMDKWLFNHLSTFERELLVRRYFPIHINIIR